MTDGDDEKLVVAACKKHDVRESAEHATTNFVPPRSPQANREPITLESNSVVSSCQVVEELVA